MKNTNPIFSLKNFRSFGEEGADFELAPITVLTGCNSAGKSSLVKAMLLLSKQSPKFIEGIREARHIMDQNVEIDDARILRYQAGSDIPTNKPTTELKVSFKELGLGGYGKVLHHNAKDGVITITIRKWSEYLHEEVIIKRVYEAKNDILDEGKLKEFVIEKSDGTMIYKYFYNTGVNYFDSVDGFSKYTVEWDERDDFEAVREKCDIFVDASEYFECRDFVDRVDRFANSKLIKRKEVELKLADVRKRMNELEVKYGKDQIIEFVSTYDEKLMSDWNESLYSWDYHDLMGGHKLSDSSVIKKYIESLSVEERQARVQNNFLNLVINDCIDPWFIKDIAYIDSSSASVRRLYSVEDENKMCVALSKLVNKGKTGDFVNKWLKEKFEIGDCIELEGTKEGVGVMAYLVKGENKSLLADEGYGITQLISLLLQIENNINEYKRFNTIWDEGDGRNVPYSLNSFIAVEEPEVHLHPKYQSMLAEMFVEAYQKYNIHFIIETHSEYLIRKLQVMVADKEIALSPDDVSLNYVEKDGNGVSTNRKIDIDKDGGLNGSFGAGFYDEADTLAMDLFRKKPILS